LLPTYENVIYDPPGGSIDQRLRLLLSSVFDIHTYKHLSELSQIF